MKLTRETFERLQIYEDIMDLSNDGVNVVDETGRLIFVNKVSADYCNSQKNEMVGKPIEMFYPNAMLLTVLRKQHAILNGKIHYIGNKKYMCSSFPIYNNGEFIGAFSVFRDIQEIDDLNRKVKYLEMQVNLTKPESNVSNIVGYSGTLNHIFEKAKKTVGSLGGPRHSIITGQSGTGKTMLANQIYTYAKQVGVISSHAPFIEVNCAQFTNPDIAAMEIFVSEEGAYTGSKRKKGLFEQADGGILFLDEAHTLENYQNMLLKAIESGKIRRIGGTKEIEINVIIIAASTRDLKDVLLPELYQRLAQYEMYLPSLKERSMEEKELLMDHFIRKYEEAVKESHHIDYHVQFTPEARLALLNAVYPRNIRQFRDVINFSIDSSSPLIEDIHGQNEIYTTVTLNDIPFNVVSETLELTETEVPKSKRGAKPKLNSSAKKRILTLAKEGLGPRKIANTLKSEGFSAEYYQVAYFLKQNL